MDKNKRISTLGATLILGGFFVVVLVIIVKSIGGNSVSAPAVNSGGSLTGIKADLVTPVLSSTATAKYPNTTYTFEKFTGDGRNSIFLLSDSYDDITIYVNGVITVIGTYREGTPCGSEVCYDFEGKRFIFSTPPLSGAIVTLKGIAQARVDAYLNQ